MEASTCVPREGLEVINRVPSTRRILSLMLWAVIKRPRSSWMACSCRFRSVMSLMGNNDAAIGSL
jgi:hypothetical protein